MTQLPLEPPNDLRERLAQLVMVRLGSNLPPILRAHEDERRVAALINDCPIGGLLLFNGVWPEVRASLDRLQGASRVPLIVASDIERGAGQQVAGLTVFPHQRAFVDDPNAKDSITEFCQTTAAEAQAAGIHITFGPVADVNSDPRNPIIATRAFGDDPARAAELVDAYVRACESAGLLATAKHFPGHGDTHQDSHEAMPRVTASAEELAIRELVPFKAAIEAGVSLIMTAHVEYPSLDASGLPATLSKPILTDLLRGELGFEGVVCSDSLLMAGVRDRFDSEGEMALAALVAGVDLLLDVDDPPAVVNALLAAAHNGRLPAARLDEAFDRVWRLKQVALSGLPAAGRSPKQLTEAQDLSKRVAALGTRIVSASSPSPLPLDSAAPLTALVLKPHHRPTDPDEQPLAAALRERFAEVRYHETGPEIEASLVDKLLGETDPATPIVVAMIVKPAAWHAFGLTEPQDQLVRALLEDRQVVLACLGVENALDDYPEAAVRIVTHSDVPASQQALVEELSRIPA